jgi:alkylation response protein AidB-like acyl-CoA dehydrogenase
MSPEFPAFALSDEHVALRESVRALAEEKIAPHAAEVDELARFPQEVHDALVKAHLHAVHIPGPEGAQRDAACPADRSPDSDQQGAGMCAETAVRTAFRRGAPGTLARARIVLVRDARRAAIKVAWQMPGGTG